MDHFHTFICWFFSGFLPHLQVLLVIARERDWSMTCPFSLLFLYDTHMFQVFQIAGSDCHIHTKSHSISFSTLNNHNSCFSQAYKQFIPGIITPFVIFTPFVLLLLLLFLAAACWPIYIFCEKEYLKYYVPYLNRQL